MSHIRAPRVLLGVVCLVTAILGVGLVVSDESISSIISLQPGPVAFAITLPSIYQASSANLTLERVLQTRSFSGMVNVKIQNSATTTGSTFTDLPKIFSTFTLHIVPSGELGPAVGTLSLYTATTTFSATADSGFDYEISYTTLPSCPLGTYSLTLLIRLG